LYSEKVLDHFHNPRNVGYFEDAEGMGQVGDPDCGDYLLFFLRIRDGQVTGARFLCRGCPAAIACASVTAELVMDRQVDDLWDITDETIVEALDGLPEEKLHCSNLGAVALQIALLDYFERRDEGDAQPDGVQAGGDDGERPHPPL
jgi:nitrogen fixation protein NifU and related proteins